MPPGPKGRPFLGVLPEFWADPFEYLRGLHDQYGDVVRVPLPLYDVVIFRHPDHIAQTTNNPATEYSMIGSLSWMPRILGTSTPMLEGDTFRERRCLVMPMFSASYLAGVSEVIAEEFAKYIDRWERFADSGETIDLQHEIAKVSLHGFLRAMCSYELPPEDADQFAHDFPPLGEMVSFLFMTSGPPRHPIRLARGFWRVHRWCTAVIDERLADPNPPQDLLQVLIEAGKDGKAGFDRKSLIMELLIMVAGGFETVVAATSWTLGLLPSNPAAQQRLWDEVDQLGGALPSFDDLARLPWTKACFDEGQRLQGHPFMPRFAMIDDVVGGYRVGRKTLTGQSFYSVHRDPRWWGPDADVYEPNRFYDKAQVAQRPNLSFVPFGSGQHRCLGSAMAYMNGQFLLTLIHQRFRVHLQPGWTPQHMVSFSVPIKGGLPVTLTRAPRPDPDAVVRAEISTGPAALDGCPMHLVK